MNDEQLPKPNGSMASSGTAGNGRGPSAQVRSGLAQRRNPVSAGLEAALQMVARVLLRDPLTTFLALASIGLALAFALLLGSIGPSSVGRQIPLSRVEALTKNREIALAVLLDHDNRVEPHNARGALLLLVFFFLLLLDHRSFRGVVAARWTR